MNEHHTIQCIGFIMDGNRRWAKAQELPTVEGHAKGYQVLLNVIELVHVAKIPHMVCYAFSTENWKRTEEEVGYLMNLLEHAVTKFSREAKQNNKKINVRIIGQQERLSKNLQHEIHQVESENIENPELTVWIAFSYGGRAEIVHAVNQAVEAGEKVTEETFEKLLWTGGMPDPDLIIRTSGEIRMSNFLIWQSAYSELFFTDTLWPDFGEIEFKGILEEYQKRDQRRGT